jgi:hypothetical protein
VVEAHHHTGQGQRSRRPFLQRPLHALDDFLQRAPLPIQRLPFRFLFFGHAIVLCARLLQGVQPLDDGAPVGLKTIQFLVFIR